MHRTQAELKQKNRQTPCFLKQKQQQTHIYISMIQI